jgi:hypothetical protein
MESEFEIVGTITEIETIAVNLSIREHQRMKSLFGGRRWRKLKAIALVRFPNGEVHKAELHWYEAHGVGRRKMKIKRRLDLGEAYEIKFTKHSFRHLFGGRRGRGSASRQGLSDLAGCESR